MNHLVIDLEMCTVPRDFRSKKYRYMHETIQIGAVLLDENYKRIGTLSQYVKPEYGVIDPFIHRLTGIDNSQVRHAPLLQEALERADIDIQGRFHDGLDDAVNTGRLIEKLELDPELQLVKYEVPEKNQGECVYSLGSILSGLNLKLA